MMDEPLTTPTPPMLRDPNILLQLLFWSCAACILYAYALYPAFIALLARTRCHTPNETNAAPTTLSIVLTAFNEQSVIVRRLTELFAALRDAHLSGEIIVVSDGSTDQTVPLIRETFHPAELDPEQPSPSSHTTPLLTPHAKEVSITLIPLPHNVGKAAALTRGVAAARADLVVFADARQTWNADTLPQLLSPFADPRVGAVSGELVLAEPDGTLRGVGLYWRYEKWLRRNEGRFHSVVGVSGSVSAVRRPLFSPIPAGTLLDDVYWPLRVVMQGHRVLHCDRARAFDRLPARPTQEFRRKVRTLSGNFQLLARLPSALLPWRNPLWFQFLSHKLLRLLVPWAMLAMLLTSAFLPAPFYRLLFCAQLAFYAVALLGTCFSGIQSRPVSVASSFVMLNAAAWAAFWVWLSGNASRSWHKVTYQTPSRA